jgi:hypothetical protein
MPWVSRKRQRWSVSEATCPAGCGDSVDRLQGAAVMSSGELRVVQARVLAGELASSDLALDPGGEFRRRKFLVEAV